jgi:PST family polysaccharide transporter
LINERFRIGTALREIIKNTGWLFGMRILRILFALFVTAWVARYLGRDLFGIYHYGLAFVGLFGPFAVLGLTGIVVRDIVRDPEAKDEILGTVFLLRLGGGIVGFALVLIVISFVRGDDPLARRVTSIIALTLFFQSLSSIDMWFQSRVQSKFTVIAKSVALTTANLLRIAAILTKASVTTFAAITVVDAMVGGAGLVIAYRSQGFHLRHWRFSLQRTKELLGQSWMLVLSGAMAIIYFKIDQVMLGEMAGEAQVGVYSTATRISEVWYFIPIAISTSIFPALIRSKERGQEIYYERLQQLYDFLAWLALLVAVAFTFAARPVILIIFGSQYAAAGPILSVHIWAGLFIFLKTAMSRWLLNENELKFLFISNGMGAAVNVLMNLWLIPLYGGMGAAIATVVSYACAGQVSCFLYRPTWKPGWMMLKATFVPLRAAAHLIGRMRT